MTDSVQDFRNIEKALRLVRAYRQDRTMTNSVVGNPAYHAELQSIVAFDTPEEIAAEFDRVVESLVNQANTMVDNLAQTTNAAPERVLNAYGTGTSS